MINAINELFGAIGEFCSSSAAETENFRDNLSDEKHDEITSG